MPQPADIGSKRLIGLDPERWARWITGQSDIDVERVLGANEFQWVARAPM
ncbi:MAG: hypothetical protein HC837_01330 [Chloroflexaceae bacterium]|nr:hypothetical protein [Chloroflexaceae bacterium]